MKGVDGCGDRDWKPVNWRYSAMLNSMSIPSLRIAKKQTCYDHHNVVRLTRTVRTKLTLGSDCELHNMIVR